MLLYDYRTLGSVACIISERKIVHHSIINSLDSHDKIELESAIVAASLFAAKSKYVCSSFVFLYILNYLVQLFCYFSVICSN